MPYLSSLPCALLATTLLSALPSAQTPPGGQLVWVKQLGTAGADYAYDVACTPNGSCAVVGEIWSDPDREGDLALARFNASGTLLWTTLAGGPYSDRGLSVEVKTLGSATWFDVRGTGYGPLEFPKASAPPIQWNLDIERSFTASFGLNGFALAVVDNPLDELPLPSRRAEYAPRRGAIESGWFDFAFPLPGHPLTSAGGRDAYLAEFPVTGGPSWAASFGGPGMDWATAVTLVPNEAACIVVGGFEGTAIFPDSQDAGTLPDQLTAISLDHPDVFVAKFTLNDGDGDGLSDLFENQ